MFPQEIEDKIKSYLIGWRIKTGDCFYMEKGYVQINSVHYLKNGNIRIQGNRNIIHKADDVEICGFQINEKAPTKYNDFYFIDRGIILTNNNLIKNLKNH